MKQSIAKIRAVREPYRRAGIELGRDTKAFSIEAEAPLTDAQVDPKWGKFAGDIVGDQVEKLKADPNVLIEIIEVGLEASPPESFPLTDGERDAIADTILNTARPLVSAEGFKVNKTQAKTLLKPIREALKEAEHPADKLEVAEVEGDLVMFVASYGDETVRVQVGKDDGGDA